MQYPKRRKNIAKKVILCFIPSLSPFSPPFNPQLFGWMEFFVYTSQSQRIKASISTTEVSFFLHTGLQTVQSISKAAENHHLYLYSKVTTVELNRSNFFFVQQKRCAQSLFCIKSALYKVKYETRKGFFLLLTMLPRHFQMELGTFQCFYNHAI